MWLKGIVLMEMKTAYLQRWGLYVGSIAEAWAFDYHASVPPKSVHTHLLIGTVVSSSLTLINICSENDEQFSKLFLI